MGVDGAEEGDAAAVLVWMRRGRLVVCRGEGNGGRTLVEEAVELELLD